MLLSILAAAAATCPTWNAAFQAERLPGATSSALRYRWSEVPTCGSFEFDHYEVCWTDGDVGGKPSAPAAPGGCAVAIPDATRTATSEHVYRSNHAFAARIFACADRDCTSWYPSTTHTVSTASTARERWVVTDVDGYGDDDRLINDNNATAASAFVYPDDFASAGHLGVWYSTGDGGGQRIRHLRSLSTAWGHWNTNGTRFEPFVNVASSAMGLGAFGWVTHPWAVPAMDAGFAYVRMFVQADDDNNPAVDEPYKVWSIDSLDEDGTDYGLVCKSSGCAVDLGACSYGQPCDWLDASLDGGVAMPEVEVDGDAASSFLTRSAHGSVLFSWFSDDDGAIDFGTESPSLVFTGAAEGCTPSPDDIFVGAWDGAGWDVPIDSSNCPTVAKEDAHDPSAIPLPDGTSKVYYQIDLTHYEVCRLNGHVLEDCQPIDLAFDDGTPLGRIDTTLGACTDNFTAFSALVDGRLRQGSLIHAMGSGGACFNASRGGILFAELQN